MTKHIQNFIKKHFSYETHVWAMGIEKTFSEDRFLKPYVLNRFKKGEKYFVLRICLDGNGPMKVFRDYVRTLPWIEENGFKPIVCWSYTENFKRGDLSDDFWSEFFNQPVEAKDVTDHHMLVSKIYADREIWAPFAKEFNGDENVKNIRVLQGEEGRDYYSRLYDLSQKAFTLKPETYAEMEKELSPYFVGGKKIMGVMMRENFSADFKNAQASDKDRQVFDRHPTAPGLEEAVDEVARLADEWNCDYVLVSCAWEKTVGLFKEKMGDRAVFAKRPRKSDAQVEERLNRKKALADMTEKEKKDLGKSNRDSYRETTRGYLSEIYMLAKCDCFAGAVCGGTEGALILNGGKYEKVHIFSDESTGGMY